MGMYLMVYRSKTDSTYVTATRHIWDDCTGKTIELKAYGCVSHQKLAQLEQSLLEEATAKGLGVEVEADNYSTTWIKTTPKGGQA